MIRHCRVLFIDQTEVIVMSFISRLLLRLTDGCDEEAWLETETG